MDLANSFFVRKFVYIFNNAYTVKYFQLTQMKTVPLLLVSSVSLFFSFLKFFFNLHTIMSEVLIFVSNCIYRPKRGRDEAT